MTLTSVWKWVWERKKMLLIGALVCMLGLWGLSSINISKDYQIRISFVYPGAENGRYPDGHRLLRDDLIATERVQEALEAMHSNGWYTDIPAKKIQNNLTVHEYLTNPVQDKVQTLRAQGEEYTYYSNEFIISFKQPLSLHLKDSSDFFGVFRENRSKEFVEELVRAVLTDFTENHTEGDAFAQFADYMEVGDADYSKIVDAYNDKVDLCINYLNKKNANDRTFVSARTGLSFDDLIIAYQSLQDVQIDRLMNYTSSEKITRSLDELTNQMEVEIENQNLTQKKKADESEISKSAMMEYDHTFSENIIIVSVNEENGLYQARPKTAFDTVTQRSLDAGVAATNAANTADDRERLIQEYSISMNDSEAAQKIAKAEEMVDSIYAEYARLCDLSSKTIMDYQQTMYNNYIKTTSMEEETNIIKEVVMLGVYFAVGLCVTSALCLLMDKRKQTRKM